VIQRRTCLIERRNALVERFAKTLDTLSEGHRLRLKVKRLARKGNYRAEIIVDLDSRMQNGNDT